MGEMGAPLQNDNEDEVRKALREQQIAQEIECEEYVEILRDSLLYGYGVMIAHGLCDTEKYHKIDWTKPHCFENVMDVWWCADDGGLILLIPYIMCLCTYWSRCKVRINLIREEKAKRDEEKEMIKEDGTDTIQALIDKFRLNKIYHDEPRIVYVKNNNPSPRTLAEFERLSGSKMKDVKRQNVVLRWLRLSELLNEYSKNSMINIVTLPVPTSHVKAKEYVALLHMLSDQERLPPTIIMRGNGEQTLTF